MKPNKLIQSTLKPTLFLLITLGLIFSSLLITYEDRWLLGLNKLSIKAFVIESVLIMLLLLMFVKVTGRFLFSSVLLVSAYTLIVFANTIKIKNLEIPLVSSDFIYLSQIFYLEFSKSDVVVFFATVVLSVLILWCFYRLSNKTPTSKYSLFIPIVLIFLIGVMQNPIAEWLNNSYPKINRPNQLNEKSKMGQLSFLLKNFFVTNKSATRPIGYSETAIQEIIAKYSENSTSPDVHSDDKPNVIIFLIEAFSDPNNTGFNFTQDPMPNMRVLMEAYPSGTVVSPVIGGRSANTEFELLTGFSMRFLPSGSIPFIDLLNKPIHSMVHLFNNHGYETHSIHVAGLSFFNYKQAYPNLGFQNLETLKGKRDVEFDPANRYPNETSLIKEIIKKTKSIKPQFIHAFPNSTHGRYDYDVYSDSGLSIENPFSYKKHEMDTYINAVKSADKAIGELIQHFESVSKKTIILVLGDHLPGLMPYRVATGLTAFEKKYPGFMRSKNININNINKSNLKQSIDNLKGKDAIQYHLSSHGVPYLFWSNFPLQTTKEELLSMNMLNNKIIEALDMNDPFYNLTKKIKKENGVLSYVVNDFEGYSFEASESDLIKDYEMIQYDILYGENYYDMIVND